MKYVLLTPDGHLAVFDESEMEFVSWDHDPVAGIDEIHERAFPDLSRRLLEAEISFAKQELSPLADWEPGASKFATRWERAVGQLVLAHSSEQTLRILADMDFADYEIPEFVLEEEAVQNERRIEEQARRDWILRRPNPIVDSTKDEDVWNEI